MLSPIFAVVGLLVQPPPAVVAGTCVVLPHQPISINATYAPIGEVARQAFAKLNLKLGIAPRARAVADSNYMSVGMNNVPFDVVIYRNLVRYTYLAPALIVRKEATAYILDLPTVSLWVTNEQPGIALHSIFDQVGCDYCVDLEALGPRGVTVSIENQPLDVAFRLIAAACKSPSPISLDFIDGCFMVRSTSRSKSIETDPSPKVMARFVAHNRREVIAALLDCYRQNYVITGAVAGIVTVDKGMLRAIELLRSAFAAGSEQYISANMDNVYMIFPDSALGDTLGR